jgi:hypothetical protein
MPLFGHKHNDSDGSTAKPGVSFADEPYILRITVHSCTHLLAKDLNATSDPYVKVLPSLSLTHTNPTSINTTLTWLMMTLAGVP